MPFKMNLYTLPQFFLNPKPKCQVEERRTLTCDELERLERVCRWKNWTIEELQKFEQLRDLIHGNTRTIDLDAWQSSLAGH